MVKSFKDNIGMSRGLFTQGHSMPAEAMIVVIINEHGRCNCSLYFIGVVGTQSTKVVSTHANGDFTMQTTKFVMNGYTHLNRAYLFFSLYQTVSLLIPKGISLYFYKAVINISNECLYSP